MIYITPLVITFHRRGDNAKTKADKNGGKNTKERIAGRRGKRPNRGRRAKRKKSHPKKRNQYYAELRASCFSPHLLVFLIRQAADR